MRLFPRRLPAARWKRILVILAVLLGYLILMLVMLGVMTYLYLRSPGRRAVIFQYLLAMQLQPFPKELPSAATNTPVRIHDAPTAVSLSGTAGLFDPLTVWEAHLRFSSNAWLALAPRKIKPIPIAFDDSNVTLRNPNASRPGVLGVIGFDLPWSTATEVEFGGVSFTNVGARHKGNGTYLDGMNSYKRSFKLELDREVKDQRMLGLRTLNLHSLAADLSFLSDALGYEYFRAAGVPASRTTFVDVRVSIDGVLDRCRFGLYLVVENPDGEWVRERFGRDDVVLFKPVTIELFRDLGSDWSAYEPIYDPRGEPSTNQKLRLIELCRLVTHATDAEFAGRVAEFLDLGEVAAFLAAQVLLSNYDGPLATGQNFLLYLDVASQRFGLAPWDLDRAWGEFPLAGTPELRERADVWQPWVPPNRFLERLFGVESFRRIYRSELERQLDSSFRPDRLHRRIDELALAIRPWALAESPARAAKFETAVSGQWIDRYWAGGIMDPARPVHQLKRFISTRAESVRGQLEGRLRGARLDRRAP